MSKLVAISIILSLENIACNCNKDFEEPTQR